MSYRDIRIEDYHYDLPQDRIATHPVQNRDESKLLVYRNCEIFQKCFSNLPDLLPGDSLIIWNDTKVIPARLEFKKSTGALIEIFLIEPMSPSGYTSMFNQQGWCIWYAMIGNQKRWKGDSLIQIKDTSRGKVKLFAEYGDTDDKNKVILRWTPEDLTLAQVLDIFGKTPIPPYLKRDSNELDKTRYQTVYANFDGSVAAPTAGLHFTHKLIAKLQEKNISFKTLTLHVGSGTFVPVKSVTIGDHPMHAETVIIDKSVIRSLLVTEPGKLTVVGTTSLRSLESLFWLGQNISRNPDLDGDHLCVEQWDPYNQSHFVDVQESLYSMLNYLEKKGFEQVQFLTRLMIVPGYRFRLVNRLITNFHQPCSTLLLLVSALVGPKWRDIYHFALDHNYRFLSYGDSSLLEMQPKNNG